MSQLGRKAIAILQFAALPNCSDERRVAYQAACAEFSEKAVCVKCQELVDRGYMECGVSARTGWLTEKGRAALGIVTP